MTAPERERKSGIQLLSANSGYRLIPADIYYCSPRHYGLCLGLS